MTATEQHLLARAHAPGHLRNWFIEYVEATMGPGAIRQNLPEDLQHLDLHALVDQLWDCMDIMPRTICEELDMPPGSSFGDGARVLARQPS